ncbi:hypothetical protein [Marinifilum caeruleilacunae]|uniref:Uncharacterized protein n=1 Tax=Marinifilum caeruleilacunae TaxID=2499076 RepID=A0ABX1WUS6_9BACT|nr:hypothetical protein [Marinifilum caeruleilacunae]NOU59807.1 hypothetical protein [Marinifilum caeruleilacunae]
MKHLSYTEKCSCESNQFCMFVNEFNDFSDQEKELLTKQIVQGELPNVLYVSGVLAVWSVIAGVVDAILFPGIIVYAIFHGVIDYKVLTPPILFLTGNLIVKLIYIYLSLKHTVRTVDIMITALPYAGSAYLIKKFFFKDKLLTKAVSLYLKNKKQEFKRQMFGYLKW